MSLLVRVQLLTLLTIILSACAGSSINVNIKGDGGVIGTVNGSLRINCGTLCLYSQAESFNMSLTAITKDAQTFLSWEGDGNVATNCGINPVCDVLVPPSGKFNVTAKFGEVDLRDCETTPTSCGGNVALEKPTSQSSTYENAFASRAVDGNTNGDYHAGSVSITNNEFGAWWKVDLGEAHQLSKVVLWNRTDCCSDRLVNFNVDYLDATGKVIAKKNHAGAVGATTTIHFYAVGVHSVRVQLTNVSYISGNYLQLAEVQVFGAKSKP